MLSFAGQHSTEIISIYFQMHHGTENYSLQRPNFNSINSFKLPGFVQLAESCLPVEAVRIQYMGWMTRQSRHHTDTQGDATSLY